MEQFIGCDAHKKFSVFVAVNEKGRAGEASAWPTIAFCTVSFWRDCRRIRRSRWKPAEITIGWLMRWNGQVTIPNCVIRWRPNGGWD